ncbi:MAG: cobalamin-binding protein [Myxococcota bacterium]
MNRSEARIVSLLPSATEIVCAVGARERLVGRSHECDHPAGLDALPVLTRPRRRLPQASGDIDRTVREIVAEAIAVYEIDLPGLETTAPDVIVTQDLCDVCAVSLDDVREALQEMARRDVEICSLSPLRLADVWADVRRVGRAVGHEGEGDEAAARLEARCEELAAATASFDRPKVLTIEWLDPVMIGGTWMPELVEISGGEPLVTKAGEHAPTLDLEALRALDPDIVVLKPCGFDVARTLEEAALFRTGLPWADWKAARVGEVYVADGNAYFNRPGPRLVESAEILAAILHPDAFPALVARHGPGLRRIMPSGEARAFG